MIWLTVLICAAMAGLFTAATVEATRDRTYMLAGAFAALAVMALIAGVSAGVVAL